jgi:hypothetical protein
MCGICMRTPCHSRCPNAPEPPIVHRCIHCNAPIVEGEDYYDVDGEPWCEDCMKKCHKTAEVDE